MCTYDSLRKSSLGHVQRICMHGVGWSTIKCHRAKSSRARILQTGFLNGLWRRCKLESPSDFRPGAPSRDLNSDLEYFEEPSRDLSSPFERPGGTEWRLEQPF